MLDKETECVIKRRGLEIILDVVLSGEKKTQLNPDHIVDTVKGIKECARRGNLACKKVIKKLEEARTLCGEDDLRVRARENKKKGKKNRIY